MKKFLLPILIFSLCFAACSSSTSGKEDKDDETTEETNDKPGADERETGAQSDPVTVVRSVFKAAKSGDYSGLGNLCYADGDGDVKQICDIENQPAEKQEEFRSYFKSGKVVGDAEIEGTEAKVQILFGPDGDRKETMNLVRKNKKWYLSSF